MNEDGDRKTLVIAALVTWHDDNVVVRRPRHRLLLAAANADLRRGMWCALTRAFTFLN